MIFISMLIPARIHMTLIVIYRNYIVLLCLVYTSTYIYVLILCKDITAILVAASPSSSPSSSSSPASSSSSSSSSSPLSLSLCHTFLNPPPHPHHSGHQTDYIYWTSRDGGILRTHRLRNQSTHVISRPRPC